MPDNLFEILRLNSEFCDQREIGQLVFYLLPLHSHMSFGAKNGQIEPQNLKFVVRRCRHRAKTGLEGPGEQPAPPGQDRCSVAARAGPSAIRRTRPPARGDKKPPRRKRPERLALRNHSATRATTSCTGSRACGRSRSAGEARGWRARRHPRQARQRARAAWRERAPS